MALCFCQLVAIAKALISMEERKLVKIVASIIRLPRAQIKVYTLWNLNSGLHQLKFLSWLVS